MSDAETAEDAVVEEMIAFEEAVERYTREACRAFPLVTELLQVAHSLGYRKVAEPIPLPKRDA